MTRKRRGRALGALLLAVLVGAGVGWWLWDSLAFFADPPSTEVSPEAAAAAEAKLERLREEGEPARLSGVELSSLLRYGAAGWSQAVVSEPLVEMSGDTLRVSGTVPTDRLPSHPELDQVRAFLPDTGRVRVTGALRSSSPGRAELDVLAVEFANIPIPARYYPSLLEGLGRRDEPGLRPNSLALRLPPGVSSARVEDGSLVLTP